MIRLGLIGFPVSHSLSPKLQGAALRYARLDGEYRLYPVDPAEPQALADLLGRVRSGELTGLNVTIPHKQAVIPHLDALTPSAQSIGAVNLIYMRDGKLTGHNTDAPGFLSDLNRFLAGTERPAAKTALVLGAGGSARSVVYALAHDGWQVTVAARRLEQARGLLVLHVSLITCHSFADLSAPEFSSCALIVNTTPLGMTPGVNSTPWALPFPPGAAVYDLVYNPRETRLVREARAAGLPAITGLGMLMEQAILGFEIWTGRSVPREVMFAAVEES